MDKREWEHLMGLALERTNAVLSDDAVLSAATAAELHACCRELLGKYREHPIVLETLADFADDPQERVDLYSRASIAAAQRGWTRHTIHVSWASALLDGFCDPESALRVLEECEGDLSACADQAEREEYAGLRERAERPRRM